MTLKIELTAEERTQLSERARQEGLPMAEYARRRLVAELMEPKRPMTGAEALEYWRKEGVLGLFADRPDSPDYARELRRQAETRDRGC